MKIKKNKLIEISYKEAKKVMNLDMFIEIPINENNENLFPTVENYIENIIDQRIGPDIRFFVFLHNEILFGTIISDASHTAGNNECEKIKGIEDLKLETTYLADDDILCQAEVKYDILSNGEIKNIRYGYFVDNEIQNIEETYDFEKEINNKINYIDIETVSLDLENLTTF